MDFFFVCGRDVWVKNVTIFRRVLNLIISGLDYPKIISNLF